VLQCVALKLQGNHSCVATGPLEIASFGANLATLSRPALALMVGAKISNFKRQLEVAVGAKSSNFT